jgi:hypothetical protein
MKLTLLSLLSFSALALLAPLRAADDPRAAKLAAADDERVAAMKSVDPAKLGKILSDDLRYAHSNGIVDSKSSLTEALVTRTTKYIGFDYEERRFTFPAPGIALMTGRTHIQVEVPAGKVDGVLGFLAVWREEQGQWRFLAWQSCKLPPPAPAAK